MVPGLDAHLERMTCPKPGSTRRSTQAPGLGWAHAGFAPSGTSDRPACETLDVSRPQPTSRPSVASRPLRPSCHDERIRAYHLAEQSTAGTPLRDGTTRVTMPAVNRRKDKPCRA